MATFTHDPSRVHPPASAGGYPSVAAEEKAPPQSPTTADAVSNVVIPGSESSVADTPGVNSEPDAPRTLSVYGDGFTLISVAIGGSGEPHRIVFVTVTRAYRGQGRARAMMTQVLADMDADGRDSVVFIQNVEPDCDIARLTGFFESFDYVQTTVDPDYPPPQLFRAAQP